MGIFRQFPYSNFHEMNLDWLLNKMKELSTEWANFLVNWEKEIKEEVDSWLTEHPVATDFVTAVTFGATNDFDIDDSAEFNQARTFAGNGKFKKPEMKLNRPMIATKLFGQTWDACGSSTKINSVNDIPEVMNASTQYLSTTYKNRDQVGEYVEIRQIPYMLKVDAIECLYSSTGVIIPNVNNICIGMYLQVGAWDENFTYIGKITSIEDNQLFVDGWFNTSGVAGNIPSGDLYVNPCTKVWGENINVFVPQGGRCAGIEVGVISENSLLEPDVSGITVENLGQEALSNGIRIRANDGGITRGITIQKAVVGIKNVGSAGNYAFACGTSLGANSFYVTNNGNIHADQFHGNRVNAEILDGILEGIVRIPSTHYLNMPSAVTRTMPTGAVDGEIVLISHNIFSGGTIETSDGATLAYGTSTGTTSRTFSPTKVGIITCVYRNGTWFMSE